MSKKTVSDIAKEAGVSRSTVSRVLTNHPNVHPDTRKKVQNIIDQYNYQPNSLARGLVLGRINVIALIIGDIRNPFYAELTWVVENFLNKNGYMVVLCDSNYEPEKEVLYLKTIEHYNFAGVVMITAMENNDLVSILKTMRCPVVLLNRYIKSFEGDAVVIDNFSGGYIATRHLIELGHSKIGVLAGAANSTASSERLRGYKSALENFGIEYREDYVVYGDLKMESGYKYGLSLLKKHQDKPTAVFAGNDLMAIGIIEAYRENGLQIPGDLSIVGFDDIPLASTTNINLTTVRHPYKDMGETAVKLLLKKISNNTMESKKIIFDPQLIVRKSTSVPNGI